MHLIDDIHPFFRPRRGKNCLIPQRTHIVYAVVGGSVQLHHIHNGAVINTPASGTFVAGIAVDRVLAVHSLGQNFRARGFTGSPGADEQVCMAELIIPNLIFQRFRNMLLPHNIVKRSGTIFSI